MLVCPAMSLGSGKTFLILSQKRLINYFLIGMSLLTLNCHSKNFQNQNLNEKLKSQAWTIFKYDRGLQTCLNSQRQLGYHRNGISSECADFSKQDLSGRDFSNLNLSGSRFVGSSGTSVSFAGALLIGAHFEKSQFKETKWNGALYDSSTKLPFSEKEAKLRGMQKIDLSQVDRDLVKSIQIGDLKGMIHLLQIKADPISTESLFFAINQPQFYKETINLLLDFGADINQKNSNGYTVLSQLIDRFSINSESEEIIEKIKFVLSKGADPNGDISNEQKSSILFKSIHLKRNSQTITELLIKSGAFVNQRGKGCNSIVNEAIQNETLKLLLDYGAEVEGSYFAGPCKDKTRSYLYNLLTSQETQIPQFISAPQFLKLMETLKLYKVDFSTRDRIDKKSTFLAAIQSLQMQPMKLILSIESGLIHSVSLKDKEMAIATLLETYYKSDIQDPVVRKNTKELLEIFIKAQFDMRGFDKYKKTLLTRLLDLENFTHDEISEMYFQNLGHENIKKSIQEGDAEKFLRKLSKKPQLISLLPFFIKNIEMNQTLDKNGYPLIQLCETSDCLYVFINSGFNVHQNLTWSKSTFIDWFLNSKFKLWSKTEQEKFYLKALNEESLLFYFKKNNLKWIQNLYLSQYSSNFYRQFWSQIYEKHIDVIGTQIHCGELEQNIQLDLKELLTESSIEDIKLYQLVSETPVFWKVLDYNIRIFKKYLEFNIKTNSQNFLFKLFNSQHVELEWGKEFIYKKCHLR